MNRFKRKIEELIISTNQSYPKIGTFSARKSLLASFMPIWVFLLLLFLCMALLNTWYNLDTTKLASKIDSLKQEEELLKDELIKLNIEVERLTSPERIREEIVPKLNMVLPENGPIELKKEF
ncbi:cell division protein FtsL [bacterium]|nr:cell division protein FtsL [bacterium]